MDSNEIVNTSYCNKDFQSIYKEALQDFNKLSKKYNPTQSNESDPGVLLIKDNCIKADKNNYNIDKNVLECFPDSVTQIGNARKIYNLQGYNMKWYQSAITTLNFTTTSEATVNGTSTTYTIPRWTMFTNADEDIVYTLTQEVPLTKSSTTNNDTTVYTEGTGSGEIIEGKCFEYLINGENVIKLSNLDSDYRLYFTETQIAENGIFICNNGQYNYDDWTLVDNLATQEPNSSVYTFGVLPNSNTCYIEFPEDISEKFGDGISIMYVVSSGLNGNISARTITKFYADTTDKYDSDVVLGDILSFTNLYSATSGKDPETIEEAYRNYQKEKGTFNTLVTCKDYETASYNTEDVSNCVISDRTNDINRTNYIVSLSTDSKLDYREIKNSGLTGEDDPTAYDLYPYLLKPQKNVYNSDTYNTTFIPDNSILSELKVDLSDNKLMSHDYIKTESGIYYYRNDFTIKCKVVTYYKVTKTEAEEIIANIKKQLYISYNAREVDFGVEPSYDDIVETIINADSRIKTIIMDLPEYTIKKVTPNDTSTSSASALSADDKNMLIARMILAGNVQLLEFDTDFDYEFGEESVGTYPNNGGYIKSITTSATISATNTIYTVSKNENIQLYAPNFITKTTYGAYVYYTFNASASQELNVTANQDMKLSNPIHLKYTDSNGSLIETDLPINTIVRFNFTKTLTGGTEYQLEVNQTIETREKNSTKLDNQTKCYWILRDVNNNLTFDSDGEYILKDNEYFIYTDSAMTSLVILGSGTQLIHSPVSVTLNVPKIDISKVNQEGIDAISEDDWYVAVANEFTTTELQIYTYGEGTQAKLFTGSEVAYTTALTNDPVTNITSAEVKEVGSSDFTDLPLLPGDTTWSVISKLNINASNVTPQNLLSNQTITLTYTDTTTEATNITNTNILFNQVLVLSGGVNIDVSSIDASGNTTYPLKLLTYTGTKATRDEEYIKVDVSVEPTLRIYLAPKVGSVVTEYIFAVIMDNNATVTASNSAYIGLYNKTTPSTSILSLSKGLNIVEIYSDLPTASNYCTLTFSGNGYVGKIKKIVGYNEDEIGDDTGINYTTIKSNMNTIDTSHKYNYTYEVPDNDKVLTPIVASSFWDDNHIANHFTLPYYNPNSTIEIANISKGW